MMHSLRLVSEAEDVRSPRRRDGTVKAARPHHLQDQYASTQE